MNVRESKMGNINYIVKDNELFNKFSDARKNNSISSVKDEIHNFLDELLSKKIYLVDRKWVLDTIFSWESVLNIYYRDFTKWEIPQNVLLAKIDSEKNNYNNNIYMRLPIKIRLGLSLYPDLVFIELLENKLNIFRHAGINLIFKYYPWNKLHLALENKEVDIIITNHEVLSNLNAEVQRYRELIKFNKYEGFAIVLKSSQANVYEERKNKNIDFDNKAMLEVLKQLENKKVFASRNTDHRIQFKLLMNKISPKIKVYLNRNNKEPYQGFKDFINSETYDAFIGAAVHTILLDKKEGFKIILNEATEDFGAKQYNVFAVLKNGCTLSEECIIKFFSALRNGKDNFDLENKSNIMSLFELYKLRLTKIYSKNNDYKQYMLKYSEFEDVIKIMDFNFDAFDEIKKLERKNEDKDVVLSLVDEKINEHFQQEEKINTNIITKIDKIIENQENDSRLIRLLWSELSEGKRKKIIDIDKSIENRFEIN